VPVRSRRHEEDGEADKLFGQAIANVATVQAFAQEDYERDRITEIREGIYVRMLDEFKSYLRFDFVKNQLVSLGRVSVIGLCAWSAIGGSMGMGTFVFVVALTEKVFLGCYRIGNIFDRVQEASESVHRLVEVLKTEEGLVDPPNPVDAATLDGGVRFEKVTHVYGGKHPRDGLKSTRPALSDVDLEIRPGEFVGIVGPSGGGKSTLIKLLHRIDDPTAGAVKIGGVDLKMLSRPAFRQRIGYVPQEVEIFDGTIAENIAYGRHDATREEIMRAARVANAHGFISAQPQGYDQLVGNRGMRLSGGQRQRIGIARAVLLDPLIYIFDEATSHVDSLNEEKIMKAVDAIRKDKTTIMIAHRLSTVVNADRIIVMEDGRVVQVGSHAELMTDGDPHRGGGLYRRLVELQRAEDEAQ
jgi:ABC-type multidrug transport system fused ATPase/permease subunit